jgi:hypothetical protein
MALIKKKGTKKVFKHKRSSKNKRSRKNKRTYRKKVVGGFIPL